MGGISRNIDTGELITYSNNLVQILRGDKDINYLKQCLQQFKILQSQCDQDFDHVQKSIRDYQKKIDTCKQKATTAEFEGTSDAELDLLQKELKEEEEREPTSLLTYTEIVDKINNLEKETASVEKQWKTFKKFEQDELIAQRKLSMYASVTNIIPNLDDPSKISGHIVERDKNVVENFDIEPAKPTAFDTCNSIWKMIN
ncbi:hypothetical protein Adt_29647 [Abeliophyllum distichum]|uniref:Kinetochore protein Spc24 n=1 Tax=Abeliophyllum distichum TaxID=126358 RepID=A0ABD1R9W0_9LAMI